MPLDPVLDPRRASVGFVYANFGSEREPCIGREYYWYDPRGLTAAIYDDDFRHLHPEIDDETWEELFAHAFHRGELEFMRELRETPWVTAAEKHELVLGYLFGPPRAREIASADPAFQDLVNGGDSSHAAGRRAN